MPIKARLLFFDFITHFGGAQKSTALLLKKLKDRYDIRVVDAYGYCQPYLEEIAAGGLKAEILIPRSIDVVIGHGGRKLLRFTALLRQMPDLLLLTKRLMIAIQDFEPQLIWTNNIKSFFFLWLCAHRRRVSLGLYAHGWYHESLVPRWQRLLVRKAADIVFAVSNPTKEAMGAWGMDRNKIAVVFATVEGEARLQLRGNEWAAQRGIASRFIILVPGTLLFSKGQHLVLEAAEILKGQGREFEVWFAGDTGVGDGSNYRERLKRMASVPGMRERIHFLGWRSDLPDLMTRASVVVLPTYTEGLPMVIQEALLLKKPVISTPVGGIPDLIQDGRSGFLFPVGDSAELCRKIVWVMENRDIAERVAEQGCRRYKCLLSAERQIDLFCRAVEKAIAETTGIPVIETASQTLKM